MRRARPITRRRGERLPSAVRKMEESRTATAAAAGCECQPLAGRACVSSSPSPHFFALLFLLTSRYNLLPSFATLLSLSLSSQVVRWPPLPPLVHCACVRNYTFLQSFIFPAPHSLLAGMHCYTPGFRCEAEKMRSFSPAVALGDHSMLAHIHDAVVAALHARTR